MSITFVKLARCTRTLDRDWHLYIQKEKNGGLTEIHKGTVTLMAGLVTYMPSLTSLRLVLPHRQDVPLAPQMVLLFVGCKSREILRYALHSHGNDDNRLHE